MTNPPLDGSKRSFLKLGAAITGGSILSAPTSLLAAPSPFSILSGNKGLSALGRDMTGRLILPNQMGYSLASRPNNALYDDRRPIAVAMCANASDVSRCVRWAGDTGTPFVIRSGGHNYAGFSTTNGLLIDVRAMNKVSLDLKNGQATIEGGVNNEDMASALRNYSVAVPSGRCPTVGAAALCLGGGWGFAATHAGLTCDSLVSTDLVTANTRLITASDRENTDLFWALRGGGGGNFGVNTSLTFRLHEVSTVTRFNIIWPPGRQVEIMSLLQDLQIENATTLSTRSKVRMRSPGAFPTVNDLVTETIGLFWGTETDFRDLIAPALALLKPDVLEIYEEGYWRARDALGTDDPNGLYDIRSNYVETKLSEEGLANMISWMTRWPGGSLPQLNMGILFAIGGRVRDISPDATAYVHRNSNFIFQLESSWSPLDKPSIVRRQHAWLYSYYDDMQKYLQPSCYVNFPSRELKPWKSYYYGSNLPRLVEVKRLYDKHNLFKFKQSIPV